MTLGPASILAKINKLTTWQAAIIIAVVGIAVFFIGLNNPFTGDDIPQIVNNVPVHSITNILNFFEGSTFYNGKGLAPLEGIYYRPLSTTAFSLLYTIFGLQPIAFHVFMLAIYIANALLLYLVLKYSFKPVMALSLSLIFLVHPLNSQVVFAIYSMQDALFLFFGMLAMLILLRYHSVRTLFIVALLLLLSLLSKEAGLLFVAMAALYLFWFDRKRLVLFIYIMTLPAVLYLALRVNAVGLNRSPSNAPIASLSLAGRLLTAPSIMLFYLAKFVFPLQLASGYYWVYSSFSFVNVLVPLVIDTAIVGLTVYGAFVFRKRATKAVFYTYMFFTSWAVIGLLLYLQIIPLDLTASEQWFYFPMVGILGMFGVILTVLPLHSLPKWVLPAIGVILIGALGFRTGLRGLDWHNEYTLALSDITSSTENFGAYNVLSKELINQGRFDQAKEYAERSITIFPTFTNYINLGIALTDLGDYSGASRAYYEAIKYGNSSLAFEDIAELTLVFGEPSIDKQFLLQAINRFPQDAKLWMYLAILEDRNEDNIDAKVSISKAASLDQIPQFIYNGIMNNQPFTILLDKSGKSISVQ